MFPCDSLFLEMSIVSGWVSLGDNTKRIKICEVGSTTLVILGLVLHVPDLSFGLISIPTLDKVEAVTISEREEKLDVEQDSSGRRYSIYV